MQLEELLIDGLVHVTALKRDYYHFDPVRHRLIGEMTQRYYQLGDRLLVEVARVDLEDRKIDFDLVASLDGSDKKYKKAKRVRQTKPAKTRNSRSRAKKGKTRLKK